MKVYNLRIQVWSDCDGEDAMMVSIPVHGTSVTDAAHNLGIAIRVLVAKSSVPGYLDEKVKVFK